MSDTDTTNAVTAHDARPTAMSDLRFAGTIATGLVAGTLGLGALAAPLVGWKNWPEGLERDATATPVQLAAPQQAPVRAKAPKSSGGRAAQPTPGGATPLTAIGVPGPGGTVG